MNQFKPGDFVKVIGMNGVYIRCGYVWTSKKDKAVDHVYIVDSVCTMHDNRLNMEVPIYTLSPYDQNDPPPLNVDRSPLHWAEDWLEPVYAQDLVTDEEFDLVFI